MKSFGRKIIKFIDIDKEKDKEYLFKRYTLIKRGFDIIFSIGLLLMTLPILLVSFTIVFLQDLKNPLFCQQRVGLNNKEFKMYKIRSMISNAEARGYKWAGVNDSRITWFGKFIRKLRIDELPQLINVLKGEMSIIGPRPELEFFYIEFEKHILNYRDRLKVKPGITGWAQVNGGYNLSPEEKLQLDLYYIKNMNYGLDLKIIFKTIKVIFTCDGAR